MTDHQARALELLAESAERLEYFTRTTQAHPLGAVATYGTPYADTMALLAAELRAALDRETALRAEVERLEDDSARLDWMEDSSACYWVGIESQPHARRIFGGQGKGIRSAVDQAIKESCDAKSYC